MTTATYQEHYWKAFQHQRNTFQNIVSKRMDRALNAQLDQFFDDTENIQTVGEWNANLLNVTEEPIKNAFLEIYPLVGVYFAQKTNSSLNSTYKSFKIKNQADDLTPTWLEFMRNFAINEAGERIKQITLTTLTEIRKVLEIGVNEGLGAKEIGRKIRKRFQDITKWRSEMIARTEIVSASNKGSLLGAESTGLNLKKNWLATPGARTREDHLSANGQQVGLKESFIVGGESMQYPGDPNASADQTVNCRCTITMEPV